jgi:TolB-like protein
MSKWFPIAACISLTGCLSTVVNIDNQAASSSMSTASTVAPPIQHTEQQQDSFRPVYNTQMAMFAPTMEEEEQPARYVYSPNQHHKQLNDYVDQLALSLSDTMLVSEEPTIAVTSFVELNQSLQSTNQLGNQLSEGLMLALQRFGFLTVDFKVMDNVKIASSGDYSFSRALPELNNRLSADHVLSGSLIYREQGVEIQARVVNLKNKSLAASARTVIPYYVLQHIQL